MRSGLVYKRPMLERPTAESESSSWATPRSTDGEKGGPNMGWGAGGDPLPRQAVLWATPTVGDSEASGSRNTPGSKAHAGKSLTDMVGTGSSTGRMWPTPTVAEAEKVPNAPGYGALSLSNHPAIVGMPSRPRSEKSIPGRPDPVTPPGGPPTSPGTRQLNPAFVEALMGWPAGWSACEPSATVSSPSKPPSPGAFSILAFF